MVGTKKEGEEREREREKEREREREAMRRSMFIVPLEWAVFFLGKN